MKNIPRCLNWIISIGYFAIDILIVLSYFKGLSMKNCVVITLVYSFGILIIKKDTRKNEVAAGVLEIV
jgi:hypothetical protein